jgi:hypothetical protein
MYRRIVYACPHTWKVSAERNRVILLLGGSCRFSVQRSSRAEYERNPVTIGVLEVMDKPMPIGEARCTTWDESRLAV